MRWTLCIVALLLAAAASATTTLYRWVDSKGVVHYSDRPAPGATEVNIEAAQTFPASNPTPSGTSASASSADAAPQYEKLDLWKPENDETFTNAGNRIEARLRVEPELAPGHLIWFYLDGKRVDGLPQAGETFTLDNVWRGTHTLNAVVTDRSGQPLIRSQSVTFHMQQTSLNSPQRQSAVQPPRPRTPAVGGRPGN